MEWWKQINVNQFSQTYQKNNPIVKIVTIYEHIDIFKDIERSISIFIQCEFSPNVNFHSM